MEFNRRLTRDDTKPIHGLSKHFGRFPPIRVSRDSYQEELGVNKSRGYNAIVGN